MAVCGSWNVRWAGINNQQEVEVYVKRGITNQQQLYIEWRSDAGNSANSSEIKQKTHNLKRFGVLSSLVDYMMLLTNMLLHSVYINI